MKTLVIVEHPTIEISKVNKRWIEELEKYPDEFTLHKLYEIYPDGKIDVKQEQDLVESHGSVIFQFPIYWYNCPPLIKKWLDEVLLRGWAYGSKGDKFINRNIALAVTAGETKEDYSLDGKNHCTLAQVLLPFELTAEYVDAIYKGFTAFYGAEYGLTDIKIENSITEYIDFMRGI